MTRKFSSTILAAILAVLPSTSFAQTESSAAFRQNAVSVSFDDLLRTPEKYEGRFIRVTGFVQLEFEGNAIFPDEHTHQQHTRAIAFWIDVSSALAKRFNSGQRGVVEGVFTAKKHGHMDEYAGEIERVTVLKPLTIH